MPTMIQRIVTLYQFSELSDAAKEVARQWWRDCENEDSDTSAVYEDAQRMASILGIEIDARTYKTMGGGTGSEPAIYYSGFASQGDGASFDGTYSYRKGAAKAIRKEVPRDVELHRIADALQNVQSRNFYRLRATCKQSGHYMHSGCMSVNVHDSENEYRDIGSAEDDVRDALRSFADWIYSQLESENEYRMSNESVDESIESNEYTFNENGKRAD